MLKSVNLLSAESILKQHKDDIIPLLQLFVTSRDTIDVINSQYTNISFVKWTETSSTSSFWVEVFYFKDSVGNNPFKELANFALETLSLPWSNAEVERVFSQLNIVKTKLRNRLITSTVNAVLHARLVLKLNIHIYIS